MTDKPDVAELVEVTQADIDALQAAYTEQWGEQATAVYNADHWLAKAFARHRIATRAEGRREGIEEAAGIAEEMRSGREGAGDYDSLCDEIAIAIRALAEKQP